MPYKVYIKKDSKACVQWVPDDPRPARWRRLALASCLLAAAAVGTKIIALPRDPADVPAIAESLPDPSPDFFPSDAATDPFPHESIPATAPAEAECFRAGKIGRAHV